MLSYTITMQYIQQRKKTYLGGIEAHFTDIVGIEWISHQAGVICGFIFIMKVR